MTTTTKYNPFHPVGPKFGAPTGRGRHYAPYNGERMYLRKSHITQGYDEGGAYWGAGEPVYALSNFDGTIVEYFREDTRERAKKRSIEVLRTKCGADYKDIKFFK